jgi:DNA (cytosine-5)-methyltransferase 1
VGAELARAFDTEVDIGVGLKRRTDLFMDSIGLGAVRLEVMWRRKTSRAEIANYALTKLYHYGRALEFLE